MTEPPAEEDDLPPLKEEDVARAKPGPRVKTMRRALRLTQEQFAERYLIPLRT